MMQSLSFHPERASLARLFAARLILSPDALAVRYWHRSAWHMDNWSVLGSRVARLVAALRGMGLEAGDVVGLFLPTCYAWTLTDFATLAAGYVSAVYHPEYQADELQHALSLLRPRLVVCGAAQLPLLESVLARLGWTSPVLVVGGDPDTFWPIVEDGEPAALPDPEKVPAEAAATVVFTSGTGGVAKGVILTQKALCVAAWRAYHQLGYTGAARATLHWLPLSHLFGRLGPYLDVVAGSLGTYARGVDHLPEELRTAQPHVLFAVPRALTRLRQRIENAVAGRPFYARALFRCLRRGGTAVTKLPTPLRLAGQRLVRRLFRSLHTAVGGRLELLVVGGAPVDILDKRFFESLGIAVREGYGMTETAGVAAVQPWRRRTGNCGPLLPGLEARIGPDGQLHLRGESMLSAYLNAEAFDADGWFATGDLAAFSRDGSLAVSGRAKELIIPATGENVSPVKLEALLMRHPWVEDACVIGDNRPCLIALLALSEAGRVARGREAKESIEAAFDAYLAELNEGLPHYERVRGYVILVQGFSPRASELTITQKKRRAVIAQRHASDIDACYAALRSVGRPLRAGAIAMSENNMNNNMGALPVSTDALPIVEVVDLSYGYPSAEGPVEVLRHVNLRVAAGEFVAVLGASGCGKSTLFHLIGGLERPTGGQIRVGGREVTRFTAAELEQYRQADVAFVFQFFNLLPTLTAIENVMLGLEAMECLRADARPRAEHFLHTVGLSSKKHRVPAQLSGGEQQRVAIARALAKGAKVLLADEPTGNLDEETARDVMDLFVKIQGEVRSTLLLITHDPQIANRADRVMRLAKGVLHSVSHIGKVRMRLLDRKLLRDLWAIRGRVVSLTLIIASGVGIFVAIQLAISNLVSTQERLLADLQFADLQVSFLPEDTQNLPALDQLPGIAVAETRLLLPGTIRLRNGEPLAGLMVFQPGSQTRLNQVRLLSGRHFQEGQQEVVIDRALADFHGYRLADRISMQVGRQIYEKTIVGIALSAEFLVTSSNPDYVIAEPGTLGVLYAALGEIGDALGFSMVNDLLVRFKPGIDLRTGATPLVEALSRLNLEKVTPRAESYSVKSVRMDLTAFSVYSPAIIVTLLALSVAMGIITFRRFIAEKQREFAILFALGFTRVRMAWGLMRLGVGLGLLGGVVGVAVGLVVAWAFAEVYARAMHLPFVLHRFDPGVAATGLLLGSAAGLGALMTASLPLYRRSPRALLQESIPATIHGSNSRLARLPVNMRYSLRSLARQRGLTLAAIMAMAGAVAVAISYGVAMTSTFRTVDASFRHDRWDYAVDFQYSLYHDEADALVRDAGTRQAEPYYRTLVDVRSQGAHSLAQLVGLTPGSDLRRQQPALGRALAGADEAVISYDLARDLGLELGGSLALGKGNQTRTVRIVGITNDIFLRTVTVALSDAQALAQAEDKVTGYYVVGAADVRLVLLAREETARVTDKRQLVEHFRREIRDMMGIIYITILFSVVVCIVFVTTLIYLGIAEKRGEYAVLLSLGFGAKRVRRIILAGVAVQILAALVVATPMAWLIAVGLNARMGEAWFAVNTHWESSNFVWPMLATVLVGPIVGAFGVRAVLRLNIPDYLRGRAI